MADRQGKRRRLYTYPGGRWIRFRWMWLARGFSLGPSSGRLKNINDEKSVAVIGRGHGGIPKHFFTVRYEDFVRNQKRELERLEEFLGLRLVEVPVEAEDFDTVLIHDR